MKQVCGVWFPENDNHFKLGMIDEQGNYQKDTFDYAMSYIKEPKIFYDIGAHVGLWSLMAHRAGFKEIYAFEPNPETFECLKCNVEKIGAIISPHGIACRDNNNYRITNPDPDNSGAIVLQVGMQQDELVTCRNINFLHIHNTIGKFNIKPHETLVKIDTEGMEADCVLGMDKILYALRPVVCVEQRTNKDALKILRMMGMEVVNKVRKDYILTWKNQ